MRGQTGGSAMSGAVGALLVAGLLVSGCANDSREEWQVADNPKATADEIIDAGHAADIATSPDQMVVTWEVEPEDDEGPYQGAWRLYDRDKGKVADGTFGTVTEASARIDVVPVRDGFLLTDYVNHKPHFLNRSGRLTAAHFAAAKSGSSLAGGVLASDNVLDEPAWNVVLPETHQVARLAELPTREPQSIQLTSDGTVWVLLPWTGNGPFRIAHAKDGKAPWTTETIPLPKGSGTYGEGISTSGDRLFVVATREKGDRMAVDAILSREAGEKGWERIDASGIGDHLTVAPRIAVLPKGRLVATADGEGVWVQKTDDSGFTTLRPPRTQRHSTPSVQKEGRWLWSSEQNFGRSLHYSYDYGTSWLTFHR